LLLFAAASSVAGCNLLLGLDQFVDACPEVEQGLDCPDGGAGGSASTTTSTTSTTTGMAGGGPTTCTPHATRTCYDGPDGTRDVGACKHGTETCADDGSAWGVCKGETKPAAETCESTADEDCDGLDCVTSVVAWTSDGEPGSLLLANLAATPDGGFVWIGTFVGSQTFAGQSLSDPTNAGSAFVLKTDAVGTGAWVEQIASAGLAALAVDATGELYIVGSASQATTVATTPLPPGQFVLKLTASGTVIWANSIGGSSGCSPNCGGPASIAVMQNGDAVIGGAFKDDVDFGDGPVSAINDDVTGYVARLDAATGTGSGAASGATWARTFPVTTDIEGRSRLLGPYVSATTDGRANVAFNFRTDFTIDTATFTAQGDGDVGVLRLASDGAVERATQFGDANAQVVLTSTTTPQNALVIGGVYLGSMTDGFHTITAQSSGGAAIGLLYGDGFLMELPDGTNETDLLLGFGTAGAVDAAVADLEGDISLAGSFSGSGDVLGGGVLDAQNGTAVVVGRLNANMSIAWQRAYVEPQQAPILSLAVAPDGSTALGGQAMVWPFALGTKPSIRLRARKSASSPALPNSEEGEGSVQAAIGRRRRLIGGDGTAGDDAGVIWRARPSRRARLRTRHASHVRIPRQIFACTRGERRVRLLHGAGADGQIRVDVNRRRATPARRIIARAGTAAGAPIAVGLEEGVLHAELARRTLNVTALRDADAGYIRCLRLGQADLAVVAALSGQRDVAATAPKALPRRSVRLQRWTARSTSAASDGRFWQER
jgi:hypothetical protein